ncbi:MAG: VWA domain-containing protein [Polyangiaceae bacterium]|nr:VWA domain-containing protein [Polyangiaceae bacterium]
MQAPALLEPKGLLLLLLLGPLIALYILKVRRKKVVVSSSWLWASHAKDLVARSPFRKLIAQTSLLLQLLALVLLALAFARPASLGPDRLEGNVAIIVDVSASMTAVGAGGETAMDRAKAAARELVEGFPPGTSAMVVEAGVEPRVVTPLESDPGRVLHAIDALSALEVEGKLSPSIAFAIDRLREAKGAKVVVITDRHWSEPLGIAGSPIPITIVGVGETLDNAAIVHADLRTERAQDGSEQARALATIASFSDKPREVYVTVRRWDADTVLDARKLVVEPGEKTPVALSFAASSNDYGAPYTIEIAPHDAMAVDDVAHVTLPPGERIVALVDGPLSSTSPWIARALGSDEHVQVVEGPIAALDKGEVAADALVVAQGFCPPRDVLGGDLLVIAPPVGSCWGVEVAEARDRPPITSWESADPRMRFLSLDGVEIAKSSLLTPPSASMAIVRSRDGTLIADASTESRRATIVGFDPAASNWPLKASFVLFTRNVTELARSGRARSTSPVVHTGEPATVALPAGARDIAVTDAAGRPLEVAVREGSISVPGLSAAGVVRIAFTSDRRREKFVVANLTSGAESDLRTLADAPDVAGVTQREGAEPATRYRDYAWVLALVVLGVVLLEVMHHTRLVRPARTQDKAR